MSTEQKKPQWQLARIIHVDVPGNPCEGLLVWTKIDAVADTAALDSNDNITAAENRIYSNLYDARSDTPCAFAVRCLESQARGPLDFADEIKPESVQAWVRRGGEKDHYPASLNERRVDRIIYECDICGSYHPWNWDGDCRDDANRFAGPEDYAERLGLKEDEIEIRDMDERLETDERGESRPPITPARFSKRGDPSK